MSKLLETKVNELFEATKDLMSREEIEPYCEQFNTWLNTQTSYSNESLGTVLSRAGFYKKFKSITNLVPGQNAVIVPKHDENGNVTGTTIKHLCLVLCGLTQEQWDERNQTTRVTDRLSNEGQEIDPDKYLEVTGRLLESEDPHELAVGLIAATGRRPHEILARATFFPIQGQSYKVMFSGQGKKRGQDTSFEIGTLYPGEYIIKCLNRLRKEPGTKALLKEVANEFSDLAEQNRAIDNRRGQSLRRVVKEYFGDKYSDNLVLELRQGDDQNNNKALRAACAALIIERDYPGSIGSKMLAFGRFLGHIAPNDKPSDKDLNHIVTTLGYSDYYVTKPIPYPIAPQKEKTASVRVTEADFETIKNLQSKLALSNQQSVVSHLLNFYENATKEVLEAKSQCDRLKEELAQANDQIIKLKEEISVMQQQLEQQPEQQPEPQPQPKQQPQPQVAGGDLRAMIQEIIREELQGMQVNTTPTPTSIPQVKTTQSVEQTKPIANWEEFSDKELWESKAKGSAEEKVRRAFLAIASYNDTLATGDNDRLAITNQALRELSGANGMVIGDWIKAHADEVVSHNTKHGMGNSKDPSKTETYYNKRHRSKRITELLQLINDKFLDGQAMKAGKSEDASVTANPAEQTTTTVSSKTITLKATEASLMDIEHTLRQNPGWTVTTKDGKKVVAVYTLNEASEVVKV
ncbi:hypothetical protein F7734_58525 [Scytonema sp. UIC 10036]|uniref:protelomerase family protein n=1 Tax=Scytonema sp. UIC 10036 TaxID=2304196 RepID=UPI0012DA7228|nr:protelomerase family protein [Scytonema sp. UIC 10036]MUH01544.1 hypothetical protein [Scytonema sp. UIC 10036]